MSALTFMGWLALSYVGTLAIPAAQLDNFNTRFAAKVDAGDSCWDRVSGTPGTYGQPSDYTLDLACNYRLVKEQGTVYRLKRS